MNFGKVIRDYFGSTSRITLNLEKIGRFLGIPSRRRRKFAFGYYDGKIKLIESWSRKRTENYNFYYELTDKNINDLNHFLALMLECDVELVRKYSSELLNDIRLKAHVASFFASDPNMKDAKVAFARRLGWYIVIRQMKPKVVLETGVHQGVGSSVIASALIRNKTEGFDGEYIGVDIEPIAGILFTHPYSEVGRIEISDSITFLKSFQGKVDIFISDSDHSEEYEMAEYESFLPHLNSNSIIISDNSHANSVLADFSDKHNRRYIFFKEEPLDHWYPGAGIGFSLAPSAK